MYTIAVLNRKGGTGKTTIATNLAAAAHLAKKRTLLVDLDRQGSALDWGAARAEGSRLDGLSVVKADRPLPLARYREMSKGYGVVVLDAPGTLSEMTESAAAAADVVVIPLQPSAIDLWASGTDGTMGAIDKADRLRAELGRKPVRRLLVLNRVIPGTRLAREAPVVLAELGLELAAPVHQRIAFAEVFATGESVLTLDAEGAAADEIRRLWRTVSARGVQ